MRTLRVACAAVVLVALGVTPAAAQPRPPRKVAFLVGVGTYLFNFSDLAGAPENDIVKLGAALSTGGFDDVVLLKNEHATKDGIEAKFKAVLAGNGNRGNALRKDDVFLVALCGHGVQLDVSRADGSKESQPFFCPHDAIPNRQDTMVGLYPLLDTAGGHGSFALFLMDACRDAAADPDRGTRATAKMLPRNVSVLFSCAYLQTAAQSVKLKHGLFTYAVLEALRGVGRPDGAESVSWSEMVGTVDSMFQSDAFKREHKISKPQTPVEMKFELGYVQLVALRQKVKVERPAFIPAPPNFIKEDQEVYERMLFTGRGTKAYFEEAGPDRVGRWKQAAEAGDPVAQVLYGRCFYLGIAVEKDTAAAAAWYKKAADQGDVRGLLNLGAAYQGGTGVRKDEAKALDLFQAAADKNYAPAIDAVGSVAMSAGRDEEALRMFRLGAAGGYPQSMFGIGLMYEQGRGGVAKSEAEAARWFQKATDADFPAGMLKLGMAYAKGLGVPANARKAVDLYKQAVAMGDPAGLSMLGYMAERGAGVPEDKPLAAGYYRNAAEKGVPTAMYNIGVMYENGIGVTQNTKSAIEWYRKGAAKGDDDAKLGLKRLGG